VNTPLENTPPKKLSVLLSLLQFFKPYKTQVWVFLAALIFTASITLSIGQMRDLAAALDLPEGVYARVAPG